MRNQVTLLVAFSLVTLASTVHAKESSPGPVPAPEAVAAPGTKPPPEKAEKPEAELRFEESPTGPKRDPPMGRRAVLQGEKIEVVLDAERNVCGASWRAPDEPLTLLADVDDDPKWPAISAAFRTDHARVELS